MSTPDQNQAPAANGEQLFLRNALANVERAARFQRIKQIVMSVIIVPAVYYLMESPREHPTFTVVGVVGLALGLCTAKILAQLTSNTRAILQAIAALPQK
jgi:hypothetical protein